MLYTINLFIILYYTAKKKLYTISYFSYIKTLNSIRVYNYRIVVKSGKKTIYINRYTINTTFITINIVVKYFFIIDIFFSNILLIYQLFTIKISLSSFRNIRQ